MEPDACHGIDGVAEDHLVVIVEMLPPFGLFHEFVYALRVAEGLGDEIVGEQVGVLRYGAHVVPCAAVVVAPAVGVGAVGQFFFDGEHERGRLLVQRIALRVVEEAVVVGVDVV